MNPWMFWGRRWVTWCGRNLTSIFPSFSLPSQDRGRKSYLLEVGRKTAFKLLEVMFCLTKQEEIRVVPLLQGSRCHHLHQRNCVSMSVSTVFIARVAAWTHKSPTLAPRNEPLTMSVSATKAHIPLMAEQGLPQSAEYGRSDPRGNI